MSPFAVLAALALADPGPPPAPVVDICVCTPARAQADILFRGVVVDAELRASGDGRSVQPRQATIFRVEKTLKGEAATPMKVWHLTDARKCGVTFSYGGSYLVRARLKNGAAETDLCLMPELKAKDPE